MHTRIQLYECGHNHKPETVVSSRDKHGKNVIGLVLLLISPSHYLDYTNTILEEPVYHVNVTKRYPSKINKSHPRLVATLQQG